MKKTLLSMVLWLILIIGCADALITDGVNFYFSYDAGTYSGNTIFDQSPNKLNGTNSGGTLGVPGVSGTAISTDGIDDIVNVTAFVLNNSGFTYCSWINTTDSTGVIVANYGNVGIGNGVRGYWLAVMGAAGDNLSFGSGAGYITIPTIDITDNRWHYVCGVYTQSDDNFSDLKIYINGTDIITDTTLGTFYTPNLTGLKGVGASVGGGNPFGGIIDETAIWNRSLTPLEILTLYNNGVGFNPFLAILLFSQSPPDLTATNILGGFLNITYDYSNFTGVSDPYLNYSVLDSTSECSVFLNGSCQRVINTYYNVTNSSINGNLYDFILLEQDIYPGTSNLNKSLMQNTAHNNRTINAWNDLIKVEFLNVSNKSAYNVFEIMINKTNAQSTFAQAIYCNSSYTSGNITNNNCAVFATYSENDYSHCHDGNLSCHLVKRFPINTTTGRVYEVDVTETSYFVIRSTTLNGWNVYFHNDSIRSANSQNSSNAGLSWSNMTGTIDAHLYQFTGNQTLAYQSCGNNSGIMNCSQLITDDIDFGITDPLRFNITQPTLGQNATSSLNINYTASQIQSGNPEYNISLLNADFTFNKTIIGNNSNNLNYVWDMFLENFPIGTYRIQVEAKDQTNNISFIQVSDLFNVQFNSLLNVTVINAGTGSPITSFVGWIFDINLSENRTYSTTSGFAHLSVLRGNNYLVSAGDPNNFTSDTLYVNISDVNITNLTFSLFNFNSVTINIFDVDTMLLITKNVTITTVSNSTSFTNLTNTGTITLSLLTPNNYELRFNNSDYNPISKFITVLNDSAQNISVYMTRNTTAELQVIEVLDTSNQAVEGAIVWLQKETIGGANQFETIQEAQTNSEGRTSVWVERDVTIFYRFAVVYEGEFRPIQPSGNIFTTKTNFIPGITETLQLVVDLEADVNDFINDLLGIYTNGRFGGEGNNTAIFTFIDARSTIVGGRLKIFGRFLNQTTGFELLSDQTLLGSAGQLNYTFLILTNTQYRAEAYIIYQDREQLVWEAPKSYDVDVLVDKNTGLMYAIFILIVVAFVTVRFGSLVSSILTFASLYLSVRFGFIDIPISIITSMIALCVILFIKLKKK